jgi:hypothetical protein
MVTDIDLHWCMGFDELRMPSVWVDSTIPIDERMRKYGCACDRSNFSGNWRTCSDKSGTHRIPIPTEKYIQAVVKCYGHHHPGQSIDLAPYASRVCDGRMTLEAAVNAAGEELMQALAADYQLK